MMDVPKPDAVRTARTVPVTIKGQEDAVRKAKAVVESISKGALLCPWCVCVWLCVLVSAVLAVTCGACRPSGNAASAAAAARRGTCGAQCTKLGAVARAGRCSH
jgi:hypothetical protein